MLLMTYDEILTSMCDFFDGLIEPKTISRSNANIIYLIFKAVAKGLEVINSVCVAVNNKFNPSYCSTDDLISTAYLVGTEKKKGSVSGLRVIAYNNDVHAKTLPSGTYTYAFNDEISFSCTLESDIEVVGESTVELMFLSDTVGKFAVTTQQSIAVSADVTIPAEFTFSCSANSSLLGYSDETDLEFRQRIISDTDRQDVINELELKLRNLPYVFDCAIFFNRDTSATNYGSFTVPPYYMLIMLSTAMYKDEIAKIIAESAIYPTVNVSDESHELKYYDTAFSDGYYPVYVNDFVKKYFIPYVTYKIDTNYISDSQARAKIKSGLITAINTNIHKDAITSEDIFNVLNDLNILGVTIYGVQLKIQDNQEQWIEVPYVSCNKTEIANVYDVEWNSVSA